MAHSKYSMSVSFLLLFLFILLKASSIFILYCSHLHAIFKYPVGLQDSWGQCYILFIYLSVYDQFPSPPTSCQPHFPSYLVALEQLGEFILISSWEEVEWGDVFNLGSVGYFVCTVDLWTTWVWTARIHLYTDSFHAPTFAIWGWLNLHTWNPQIGRADSGTRACMDFNILCWPWNQSSENALGRLYF